MAKLLKEYKFNILLCLFCIMCERAMVSSLFNFFPHLYSVNTNFGKEVYMNLFFISNCILIFISPFLGFLSYRLGTVKSAFYIPLLILTAACFSHYSFTHYAVHGNPWVVIVSTFIGECMLIIGVAN